MFSSLLRASQQMCHKRLQANGATDPHSALRTDRSGLRVSGLVFLARSVVSLPQSLYKIIIFFYVCHDMKNDGKFSSFSIFLLGFFIHFCCFRIKKLAFECSSWVLLRDLMGKYFSSNSIDQDFRFYVEQ